MHSLTYSPRFVRLPSRSFLDSYFEHECLLDLDEDVIHTDISMTGQIAMLQRWWHNLFLLSYKNKKARMFFLTKFAIRKERTRHYRFYRGSIHPWSSFGKVWRWLIVCCAISNCILFSVTASVLYSYETKGYRGVNMMCEVILLLDIMVNFRMGYIDQTTKTIILDRKKISIHYMSTVIFLHVFSAIPYQFISLLPRDEDVVYPTFKLENHDHVLTCSMFNTVIRILSSLRIIKVFELTTCWAMMQNETSYSFPWSCRVLRTLGVIVLLMSQVLNLNESINLFEAQLTNLLHKNSLLGFMLVQKYVKKYEASRLYVLNIAKLFKAFQMSSQGMYINLCPSDRILAMVNFFLGTFFVLWCLLEAATYYYSKNYSDSKTSVSFNRVLCMIRTHQLPDIMKHRIADYFHYYAVVKRMPPRRNEMFSSLPRALKNEINIVSRRHLLVVIPMFSKWPAALIDEMAAMLHPTVYLRGDTVTSIWYAEECFNIIDSGVLAVYKDEGQESHHLIDGDYFGEISLFTEREPTKVVAITNCFILKLYKIDFEILMENHRDLLDVLKQTIYTQYDVKKISPAPS